jgi:predicted peptidase
VVPVCGAGDPEQEEALVSVPIWAVHGTADEVIPVSHSRQMITAINSEGGHPKSSELPGVGHDSWIYAYDESNGIIDWMFSQAQPTFPSPSMLQVE